MVKELHRMVLTLTHLLLLYGFYSNPFIAHWLTLVHEENVMMNQI